MSDAAATADVMPIIVYNPRLFNIWKATSVFFMAYFFVIVIVLAVLFPFVIYPYWGACSKPLGEWFVVLMSLHAVQLLLSIVVLIGVPNASQSHDLQRLRINRIFWFYFMLRFLDFVWFCWSLFGFAWTVSATCTGESSLSQLHAIQWLGVAIFIVHCLVCLFVVSSCVVGGAYWLSHVADSLFDDDSPEGATDNQINNLKQKQFEETDFDEEHRTCGICLCEFEKGENIRHLPCLHGFHQECIDPWLKRNKVCAYCRHPIDQPKP